MHDELFEQPAILARYRTGPHAESRERFLNQARADGYPPSMLERIAWALLVVAEAVQHRSSISSKELKHTIFNRVRLRSSGRPPSAHTAALFFHFGEAWLRSIGVLRLAPERPEKFAAELHAFGEYMRIQRGLSSTTIATREERMRWFFASLPPRVRSLDELTLGQIDAFLESKANRGWSRRSLRALGDSLRSFFQYAGYRGWCRSDLGSGIDLPHLYALEDVPMAPTVAEVDRLLEGTSSNNDPVKIRDHAILSLLIHYGLRRGEVASLTLEHLDWVTEKIHITRPKLRRPLCYPLSASVGEAILHYLRQARPRCSHRALFLTIKAPFRPLSGASISAMVRMRLTEQGVKLNRRGAHCLRHACASQLLDARFTLKQIADHLGHRSMNTTRVYTKINLRGLRQVAEFDLGGLL
jgi:site-specific recombinase XerD